MMGSSVSASGFEEFFIILKWEKQASDYSCTPTLNYLDSCPAPPWDKCHENWNICLKILFKMYQVAI